MDEQGLPPDHLCIDFLCLAWYGRRLSNPDHGDRRIPVRTDHYYDCMPAKLTGLYTKDTFIVGIGMAPHREVAMIVALIVLEAGIIKQGSMSRWC